MKHRSGAIILSISILTVSRGYSQSCADSSSKNATGLVTNQVQLRDPTFSVFGYSTPLYGFPFSLPALKPQLKSCINRHDYQGQTLTFLNLHNDLKTICIETTQIKGGVHLIWFCFLPRGSTRFRGHFFLLIFVNLVSIFSHYRRCLIRPPNTCIFLLNHSDQQLLTIFCEQTQELLFVLKLVALHHHLNGHSPPLTFMQGFFYSLCLQNKWCAGNHLFCNIIPSEISGAEKLQLWNEKLSPSPGIHHGLLDT